MMLKIMAVILLMASIYFLLYGIQLHGWLNPNPPVMEEKHKALNRKIFRQAYLVSGICFVLFVYLSLFGIN